MHEHDESSSSTSEDDQQESEAEESLHVTAKDTIPSARRGARLRSRSRQFNNTFKWAMQTDRHRIKLLTIVEEGAYCASIKHRVHIIGLDMGHIWYQSAKRQLVHVMILSKVELLKSASTLYGSTLSC